MEINQAKLIIVYHIEHRYSQNDIATEIHYFDCIGKFRTVKFKGLHMNDDDAEWWVRINGNKIPIMTKLRMKICQIFTLKIF